MDGTELHPHDVWLAEAAGIEDRHLDAVEAVAVAEAQKISCDCPQHGEAMRRELPWATVETALIGMSESSQATAEIAGMEAFERLASLRSKYRRLQKEFGAD